MNIKRGLNRLFVVFAACWYVMAMLILWPQWKATVGVPIASIMRETPLKGSEVAPNDSARQNAQLPQQDWFKANAPTRPGQLQVVWSQSLDGKYWCKPKTGLCYPDSAWFHGPDSFVPDDPPPRPIANTAFFGSAPPAVFGFALVAVWVLRGFQAETGKGAARDASLDPEPREPMP